jgi:predicted transcriptional regulator of viral defense system
MNKKDRIYSEALKRGVVSTGDLLDIARAQGIVGDYSYVYREYVTGFVKDGRLYRVRRGLFGVAGMDELGEKHVADKYLVGSKVRREYHLGYHTALELHGAAHSFMNVCYVVVDRKHKFQPFYHGPLYFMPVIRDGTGASVGEVVYKGALLKVSTPSRTFVDCLDRPDLAGGWEECLKSLEGLKGVKVSAVLEALDGMGKTVLRLKCGMVLEMMMERSPYYTHIGGEDIAHLRPAKEASPMYMDRELPSELVRDWGLYAPKGFRDLLRGI